MADDQYDLLPHREINELKNEIVKLKKTPILDSGSELYDSVTKLTESINAMMQLFKLASDEMKLEDREQTNSSKQFGPLLARLDEVIEQNKKIAKGIVAVADLVKDSTVNDKTKEPKDVKTEQAPMKPSFGQGSALPPSGPSFGPPEPMFGAPGSMPPVSNPPVSNPPDVSMNPASNDLPPGPPPGQGLMPPPPPLMGGAPPDASFKPPKKGLFGLGK